MSHKRQSVIIRYLPNYAVIFHFRTTAIKEHEKGGWYSVVGHEPICYTSRVKPYTKLDAVVDLAELTEENKALFIKEKKLFENTVNHSNWMKFYSKKLKEKTL